MLKTCESIARVGIGNLTHIGATICLIYFTRLQPPPSHIFMQVATLIVEFLHGLKSILS